VAGVYTKNAENIFAGQKSQPARYQHLKKRHQLSVVDQQLVHLILTSITFSAVFLQYLVERKKDFQESIVKVCEERNDDKWSETDLSRLEHLRDFHAADAVYHQACSVNFRTGKQIPKQYCTDTDGVESKRARQGRPVNNARIEAFLSVARYLKENEKEQLTICDLI
jgi:hypothetical protein